MTAMTMKLNHVDLVVNEIAENRDFLARWFGMRVEQEDETICLLRDGGGLLLILRRAEPGEAADYPRDFHLGFFLPEEATVTRLFDEMVRQEIRFTQRVEGRPAKFRCLTPADLLIEVAHVPTAI
jgi:catechol 2,3-dioxygenase-like lactoylglutathione lyase family enzyme